MPALPHSCGRWVEPTAVSREGGAHTSQRQASGRPKALLTRERKYTFCRLEPRQASANRPPYERWRRLTSSTRRKRVGIATNPIPAILNGPRSRARYQKSACSATRTTDRHTDWRHTCTQPDGKTSGHRGGQTEEEMNRHIRCGSRQAPYHSVVAAAEAEPAGGNAFSLRPNAANKNGKVFQ